MTKIDDMMVTNEIANKVRDKRGKGALVVIGQIWSELELDVPGKCQNCRGYGVLSYGFATSGIGGKNTGRGGLVKVTTKNGQEKMINMYFTIFDCPICRGSGKNPSLNGTPELSRYSARRDAHEEIKTVARGMRG